MEQVSISTTQNVTLDYEVASIGDRILATLIDYGIFAVYFAIAAFFVAASGGADYFMERFLFSAPFLLYDILMEWFCNGQSVGKMVMKIRVVKIDGTRPSIGSFLLRNILRLLDSLLSVFSIGTAAILATGTGQRVGDLAAGTTVIRTTRRTRIYDTILHRIDPNYIPAFPQVHMLTDRDISTIRDVMIVCSRTRNWDGLRALSIRVKEVMDINPNIPDYQFLNLVIKDYTNSYVR